MYVRSSRLDRETDFIADLAFTWPRKHHVQSGVDYHFTCTQFHSWNFYARPLWTTIWNCHFKYDENVFIQMAFSRAVDYLIFYAWSVVECTRWIKTVFFDLFVPNILSLIANMYRTPFDIQLTIVLATTSRQYTYIDVGNKSSSTVV